MAERGRNRHQPTTTDQNQHTRRSNLTKEVRVSEIVAGVRRESTISSSGEPNPKVQHGQSLAMWKYFLLPPFSILHFSMRPASIGSLDQLQVRNDPPSPPLPACLEFLTGPTDCPNRVPLRHWNYSGYGFSVFLWGGEFLLYGRLEWSASMSTYLRYCMKD